MQVFVLAMVSYPDVLRRAQKEIDTIIGRDRPPTFDDVETLPYVDALIREVLRWLPVAPSGESAQRVRYSNTDKRNYLGLPKRCSQVYVDPAVRMGSSFCHYRMISMRATSSRKVSYSAIRDRVADLLRRDWLGTLIFGNVWSVFARSLGCGYSHNCQGHES